MKIFNTLSGKKEHFEPIEKNNIRMYVCGMTVYDDTHIGHARTFLSFDLIVRYLRSIDYKVHYIRNITDVDDKIISRANELGMDPEELTERYINSMDDDFESTHTLEILFEELDELCDLFEEVDWYDYDEYEEDNHLQIQRKINPLELKEGLTILINQNTHLIR